MWEFLLQVVLGFLTIGIVVYAIDLQWGTRLYRMFYNWTEEGELAADVKRGFLVGRPAIEHKRWALVLAVAYLLYKIFIDWSGVLAALFGPLIAFVVLIVAFYVAPRVIRLVWQFDALEMDPEKAATSAKSWMSGLRDRWFRASRTAAPTPSTMPPMATSEGSAPAEMPQAEPAADSASTSATPQKSPEEVAREKLDSYLRR